MLKCVSTNQKKGKKTTKTTSRKIWLRGTLRFHVGKYIQHEPGTVAYTFNPRTGESEVEGAL